MRLMIHTWIRRVLASVICGVFAVSMFAVPARPGWQTRTQADGTTIEIQVIGDEFYHYTVNRDGKQVREINGMYIEVGEAPTIEKVQARRAAAKIRRAPQAIGTTPNLAPKGVVILANFSDSKMQSSHTQAVFDELCNSTNCTVNNGYPSAAQYFADQSNGSYRPVFDVFGPVTLSHNVGYYGNDLWVQDKTTGEWNQDEGSDTLATNAVVEACLLANQQFTINWADYDSDNDGYIDFVYVIYAGKGQADGGSSETIWPHNWSVSSARYYGNCTYTAAQCKIGGKTIENYAMSGELSGSSLSGIGTLCHEFGHVMGLPDLYDTKYETVYKSGVTPNDWNIMDGGSYNGNGHCPPNYDPWQKQFFGWLTPINLGTDAQNITLYANGTEDYKVYQINSGNKYQGATTSGVCYYIENRQKQGWDAPLSGHGMLVWKVNFNTTAWSNNKPNTTGTTNAPLHSVVSAYGTKIGYTYDFNDQGQRISGSGKDNCPWNTFPGTKKVTSYTPISGHALTEITESGSVITFKYNGGITGHNVIINGTGCTITPSATTVPNGQGFTATITPTDASYDFASISVTRGSTTLTQGTDYTLSSDKKTLTVNAGAVTGSESDAFTITVVWTKNRYKYELLGENCDPEMDEGMLAKNAALNLTILPASGYALNNADCWDVTMGEKTLTFGTDFTYNASNGAFTIAEVTDDVVIFVYGKQAVNWMSNGILFATTIISNDKYVLPTETPDIGCDGKEFYGWCAIEKYSSETTAPEIIKNGDTANKGNVFYAVFAKKGTGGKSQKTIYLNVDSVPASYGTDTELTRCGVTCYFTNIMKSTSSTIQLKKSGSYIANKDAIATIDSIIIEGTTALTVYAGTSAKPSSNSITRNGNRYDFTGGAYSYFSVTNNNGNVAYANFIKIYYSITGGASYSDYTTSCTPSEPVYYTIQFFDKGEKISDQSVLKGQAAEVPDNPTACSDYTFYGWWTEKLAADNTTAHKVTDFKATQDQDYYAIYSKTVTSSGGSSNITLDPTTVKSFPYQGITLSVSDGALDNGTDYRVYKGQKLTITSSVGSMTSIAFTYKNAGYDGGGWADTYTPNAESWTSPTANGEQARITQIIVTIGTGSSSTTYYTSIVDCSGTTAIENTNVEQVAVKALMNGQIVIIRGEAIYSITGARIQ